MIRSNRLAATVGDVVAGGLGTEELFVVNPPARAIRQLVTELDGREDGARVRLFAATEPLKRVTEDFPTVGTVADLVARDRLAVRQLETVPRNALLVSRSAVVALVDGPAEAAGLTATDEGFVEETFAAFERRWAEAEPFELRTPPLSEVRETLRADLGEETATDFERALEALDGEAALDEVTVSLLVAARNRELLYDISRWGEDVGLASKATFSRTKSRLEERGLLDTEKVPIDVGRPRLRLRLTDGLAEAPVAELTRKARARLSD
jgi:hypothetical protein